MAECNDYEGLRINPTPSSIGNQYAGVSTDEKPASAPTYSVYLELDTGKFYYYDGSEWQELPCCSGGEGGGGLQTAKLTATCTNPDVYNIGIHYGVDIGDYHYDLNAGGVTPVEDGLDLLLGDSNAATFQGIYGGNPVNLVLESVTGDGEIKESDGEIKESDGSKWLEVHGDCAVTLSYTP